METVYKHLFTHVEDICSVIITVLNSETNGIINISTEEETSVNELVNLTDFIIITK